MNTLTCVTEINETRYKRLDVCIRNVAPLIRNAQLANPEDYVDGWCVTKIKSNRI
tara:strand:+ start:849 stop:1013 length:165 start_codon:yes stop_codon:yes gene_type:complete